MYKLTECAQSWQLLADLAASTQLKTQLEHSEERLAIEVAAKKELKETLTSRMDALQQQVAVPQHIGDHER